MPLETYDLCPGGTGKKIKFCGCKDIVHSLDKAITAIEGDQRAAAIAQLNRLQESHPDRACVLALKAGCQFAADEFESAESTVASFISQYPDNPLALSQSAILHAVDGDLDNAVVKVQRALENSIDSLPYTVHEAIGIIGRLFVQRGNILAGRAHLVAHAAYSDEEDTRSAALLMRLHSLPEVPVLLKEDLSLDERPDDVPWGKAYDEAVELAERGAWLAAAERLTKLAEQHGSQPTLLKNIAILNSWMGRNEQAVAAWRSYASLDDISLDDAVESEATGQLLDKPNDDDLIDLVKITYPILDMEKLLERVASDKHFELLTTDPKQFGEDGQPPPRGLYVWLDRPQLASAENVSREDVPHISGQFAIFGRETDREPRIEVLVAKGSKFDQAHQDLKQNLDDLIGWEGEEEQVRRESRVSEIANSRFRFPSEVGMEERIEILAQDRRDFVLNRWPALTQGLFDGAAAQDVADDSTFRVRILAAILVSELSSVSSDLPPLDFNELREKLGLPKREKIDPWTMKEVDRCPLVRIPLLDLLKLGDDDLVELYLRAGRLGASEALRHLAEEVERRPSLDDKLDKVEVFEILAGLSNDNQKAFDYLNKARELAVASGASAVRWLLAELDMRLGRGEPDGVQELLRTIESKYIKEPGVGQELVQILVKHGLINPDGTPANMPRQAQAAGVGAESATPDESGKLWTPDGDAPESGGEEGESKLWLPGME
jgi:Flp pilus assembly protein TadD